MTNEIKISQEKCKGETISRKKIQITQKFIFSSDSNFDLTIDKTLFYLLFENQVLINK